MNKPIDRAIAKEELRKINEYFVRHQLEEHLLIGGLAVQQYIPPRNSQDLDLVCSFDTFTRLQKELYPSDQWYIDDMQTSEYRPSYHIRHRYNKELGTIIFGPKITEREAYQFIDWDQIKIEGSRKFRFNNTTLQKIVVPSIDQLAFTKLISIITRDEANTDKIKNDLNDFIDLTNHAEFSISNFFNAIKRTYNDEIIFADFKYRTRELESLLNISSLKFLGRLFFSNENTVSMSTAYDSTPKKLPVVYLAGPHRNRRKNDDIASTLSNFNIDIKVPYHLVVSSTGLEDAETTDKAVDVRSTCIQAINESDIVVVDLDTYGLDTAWEIGYAEGINKKILGYNQDVELTTEKRSYNRRPYAQNFMHGWQTQTVFQDFSALLSFCGTKSVYVIAAFSNPELANLKKLFGKRKRTLFPKEASHLYGSLPEDYPFSRREENNKFLESSDIILVLLPRYGMDAAWQIGYATAQNKVIIGFLMGDDGVEIKAQSFWDNWMHGWKQKIRVTNMNDLCAFIKGSEV